MSFLNPVSEPVLRFKSTDAGAPQINYNARVAGDVKAVLKACLVTGYGTKSSAGWSIANEVNHVAEFFSPSAAMSDYRLIMQDSSADYAVWFYSYQGSRLEPSGANTNKKNPAINGSNGANGWDLLVTSLGFIFIEYAFNTALNSVGSSVTYWGLVKSAITDSDQKNITWWNIGFNSNIQHPSGFFGAATKSGRYIALSTQDAITDIGATITLVSHANSVAKLSNINLSAEWFFVSKNNIIAQQPGVLLQSKGDTSTVYNTKEMQVSGRTVLSVWPVSTISNTTTILNNSHAILNIYLDYWEY